MLERILPAGVAVAVSREDLAADLFPAEEDLVANAVAGRRREFATGRACARLALMRLGRPPQAIGAGAHGEPRWPPGIVGSITHCDGFRGAALAPAAEFAAIAIDAEPNRPLPPGTLSAIALPQESAWIRLLGVSAPLVRWDRLLFSAKETVYKLCFALTGARLGFEDASVEVEPDLGRFTARLRPGLDSRVPLPAVLGGRWLLAQGVLLTAAAAPRPRPASATGPR